jgi:hypothetical protein
MSSNSRSSLRINLLNLFDNNASIEEIKIKPTAKLAPTPIGEPAVFPFRKNKIKSERNSKFHATIKNS